MCRYNTEKWWLYTVMKNHFYFCFELSNFLSQALFSAERHVCRRSKHEEGLPHWGGRRGQRLFRVKSDLWKLTPEVFTLPDLTAVVKHMSTYSVFTLYWLTIKNLTPYQEKTAQSCNSLMRIFIFCLLLLLSCWVVRILHVQDDRSSYDWHM